MSFGTNLRKYRKQRKLTLLDLGLRTGIDPAALSRMERDLMGYSRESVESLARALGIPQSDLFVEGSNVEKAEIGTRRIPVIDYVQAGLWTGVCSAKSESDIFEYLLTDLDLSPDAFAMRIKGDSMLPEFKEGDAILVDPNVTPGPGDFVVAANGSGEATFKQYRDRGINDRGQEVFELVPLNNFYAAIRSDVQPIRIVGTMVEHRRYRRK